MLLDPPLPSSPPFPPSAVISGRRVLVVDDHVDAAELLDLLQRTWSP
ncbi:hypothetical protein ACU6VI_09055 [Sphaerotilus natans]